MDNKLRSALEAASKAPWPLDKYAQAALENPYTGKEMTGDELLVQLNYCISNFASWRGPATKEPKAIIKKWASKL